MTDHFKQKVRELFGEVCIDKVLMQKAGLLEKSIPAFVGEWIIDRHCEDGVFNDEAKTKIHRFIKKHLPSKDQKNIIRNRLSNGETIVVLDNFMVTVDLKKDRKKLIVYITYIITYM